MPSFSVCGFSRGTTTVSTTTSKAAASLSLPLEKLYMFASGTMKVWG